MIRWDKAHIKSSNGQLDYNKIRPEKRNQSVLPLGFRKFRKLTEKGSDCQHGSLPLFVEPAFYRPACLGSCGYEGH